MMQMMMIGDPPKSNPTVQTPPWDCCHADDPTAYIQFQSPGDGYETAMAALQRYLPSNNDDFDVPADAFSCDDFRMFEFKVKRCARARSHDWTQCPFAHPGEKARRRDPRRYHYSGNPCPGFRRGACRRGDACEFAHGVFECWLHPARYRTQPCKDGTNCRRRVCFFAHTPDQLRLFPSPDCSQGRPGPDPIPLCGSFQNSAFCSPPSSPTTGSPPVSPLGVSQLTESIRDLQLNKMKIGLGLGSSMSPPSWGFGFGSPRSPTEPIRAGFRSLPSTPVRPTGLNPFDAWEEEEPVMERVESGRALREKLYSKLGKENSLERGGGTVDAAASADPDVGWVSELLN